MAYPTAPAPGTAASYTTHGQVALVLDLLPGVGNPRLMTPWEAMTLATALRAAAAAHPGFIPCTSCGAPMIFGSTTANKRNMPLDPGDHPGGNLVAWWHDDRLWVRGHKPGEVLAAGEHRVVSHYATCTKPDAHRRRPAAR